MRQAGLLAPALLLIGRYREMIVHRQIEHPKAIDLKWGGLAARLVFVPLAIHPMVQRMQLSRFLVA